MERNVNKHLLVIGAFFFFLGLFILICKNYYQYNIEKEEHKKIEDFFEQQTNDDKSTIKTNNSTINNESNYIAVIEIPKIKLSRGLVSKTDKSNNINQNITILKDSTMPDQDNSNLILVAHSGNSRISYFRNIKKLVNNDYIYLYYNKKTYIYKVVNKYEINKTGIASLQKENNSKTLTMITCKEKENKQIVVVSKLESEN